eukprot:PLAT3037.1.p1 GENE.PLAT3037.1~~PLAT3037.1.p1  ORF type:complete len:192 (-),score=8.59 PLAT3037.1:102-656(-)
MKHLVSLSLLVLLAIPSPASGTKASSCDVSLPNRQVRYGSSVLQFTTEGCRRYCEQEGVGGCTAVVQTGWVRCYTSLMSDFRTAELPRTYSWKCHGGYGASPGDPGPPSKGEEVTQIERQQTETADNKPADSHATPSVDLVYGGIAVAALLVLVVVVAVLISRRLATTSLVESPVQQPTAATTV